MVSTEAVPFAKSGGLADAVTALAQELDRGSHDVRLIMPRYYNIDRNSLFRLPSTFLVPLGRQTYECALYEGRLPDSEVVVYFVDYEELYGRDGIYGPSGGEYADNLKRFTLLSRAALGLGARVGWQPQVIHSHDWPGGLVPAFSNENRMPGSPATVFTIHNVGYQGRYPVSALPETGLSWMQLPASGLLHNDELNMMRAGIVSADMITTVSPTYAEEIRQPRFGFSLDADLEARRRNLHGVLNGVDYSLWNPEIDQYLDVNYTAETVALKERLKKSLQSECGLEVSDKVPLVGMVTRLVDQKGLEELVAPGFGSFPDMLSTLPVQFVVLGSGDPAYEHELVQLSRRYANLSVRIGFDNGLAHRIEAGADFFLMPSRYEPCGLNQLYSLRYGTIPIVTNTGGLADTVTPVTADGGTGVMIESACPRAITEAVTQAVTLFRDEPNRIAALRREGMKQRFGWSAAARRYVRIYAKAISARASA
jgi:starch synthase